MWYLLPVTSRMSDRKCWLKPGDDVALSSTYTDDVACTGVTGRLARLLLVGVRSTIGPGFLGDNFEGAGGFARLLLLGVPSTADPCVLGDDFEDA